MRRQGGFDAKNISAHDIADCLYLRDCRPLGAAKKDRIAGR
jgi:hypothetical protein